MNTDHAAAEVEREVLRGLALKAVHAQRVRVHEPLPAYAPILSLPSELTHVHTACAFLVATRDTIRTVTYHIIMTAS